MDRLEKRAFRRPSPTRGPLGDDGGLGESQMRSQMDEPGRFSLGHKRELPSGLAHERAPRLTSTPGN